jgi:hypothetical protein
MADDGGEDGEGGWWMMVDVLRHISFTVVDG